MPIVRVEMWSGKPAETKLALARDITDAVVRNLHCAPGAVMVLFDDRPKEDWMEGGVPHTVKFAEAK